MLFKNKITGTVWDVQNIDHVKRCLKEPAMYEQIIEDKPDNGEQAEQKSVPNSKKKSK